MTVRPTLQYAPPHRCRMPEPDQRDRADPRYVEYRDTRLRPDIRRRGIQQPLLAFAEGDSFRIFEGGSRLEAARLEGLGEIPVLVFPSLPSAADVEIAKHMANEMRQDFTPAERARFYLQVMAARSWTQAELCRELHLSPAKVSKTLKVFDRLPPELHARIGEGPDQLPFRAAYALTDVGDPAVLRELTERVLTGRLKVEALEDEVARLKGKPVKAAKPITVRLPGGAVLTLPAPQSWNPVQALGKLLSDAAAKGVRGGLSPRALPDLVKDE